MALTGSQFEAHEVLALQPHRRPQPQQLYPIDLQQPPAAAPPASPGAAQHWRSKSVPDAVVRQQQREQQQQQQILLLQQQQQQLLNSLMLTRESQSHHHPGLPATSTLRPRRTPSFHYQPAVSNMRATAAASQPPAAAMMMPPASQHQALFASQQTQPRTSTLRRSKTNAEDFSGLRSRSSSKTALFTKQPQHHQLGLPAAHAPAGAFPLLGHWPSIDGVSGQLLIPGPSKPPVGTERSPKKAAPPPVPNVPTMGSAMYPARSFSYLPGAVEASPSPLGAPQPNLGSSLDLLCRRWALPNRRDVYQPLHVDCSVEYDLGSQGKVPKDSAPLLIIHPAFQKRLSVAAGASPPPGKRFHPYSAPSVIVPSCTAATVTTAASSQTEGRRASMDHPPNASSAFAQPGRSTRLFSRHQSFLLPTAAKPELSFLGGGKKKPSEGDCSAKASAPVARSKSHRTKDQGGAGYLHSKHPGGEISATPALDWLQKTSTPATTSASASALHLSLTSLNFPGSLDVSGHDQQVLRQLTARSSSGDSGAGSGSSSHSAVVPAAAAAAATTSVYCDSGLGTPSAIYVVEREDRGGRAKARAKAKAKARRSASSSAASSRRQSEQHQTCAGAAAPGAGGRDADDNSKWANSVADFMSGFLCCTSVKSGSSPIEPQPSLGLTVVSAPREEANPAQQQQQQQQPPQPLVLQQQQSVLSEPWTTASSGIHSAAAGSSLLSPPPSSSSVSACTSPPSPGESSLSGGSWDSWPSDPAVLTPPCLGGRFQVPRARPGRCPTCQLSGEDCNDGFCRAVWAKSRRVQQQQRQRRAPATTAVTSRA